MLFFLKVNGKKKQFETKELVAKVYIQVANLYSQIKVDTKQSEILELLTSAGIKANFDKDNNANFDVSKADPLVLGKVMELQNKTNFDIIDYNYNIYCNIIEAITKDKFEFTQDFWDNQIYSEVENIITQFRSFIK
jgi:hypothetical protein